MLYSILFFIVKVSIAYFIMFKHRALQKDKIHKGDVGKRKPIANQSITINKKENYAKDTRHHQKCIKYILNTK